MEVMKRFKGLDPIDMMPEELWTEACNTVQEAVVKTIPSFKKQKQKQKQNKCKEARDYLKRPYK